MSALPTFCVIGAMKSGTTSLHHYLAAHPEISMSRPKELDFFVAEKNYDRGVDWCASSMMRLRCVGSRRPTTPSATFSTACRRA
jgi:hypothetical protein